ncbi:hypothetical protein [Mycobacterium sp. 852002-51057_SCH5723018]|uniref:hypothetical protein n=1 Tax=Mycobacterium sp. 852002-51057_SCH5723018 TaxID=1834094 RepID=UPI0012E9851E|nr:hypothetical protein [Mycobacterium sp. 852002-51057_SCH5723018]
MEITHYIESFGWLSAIVLVAAVFSGLIAVAALASRPARARTWIFPLTFVVCLAFVIALVATPLSPFKREYHREGDTASRPPGPVTTTPSTPPVTTVSHAELCGSAAEQKPPPDIQICVVYWCKGDVYSAATNAIDDSQMQIKVRPRILNSTPDPLPISTSKPASIRLIVDSPTLPESWQPPARTAAAADHPVQVSWNGSQRWAIPPNVNGDARELPNGFYTGFASDWHADSIPPGGSYFAPLEYRPEYLPRKIPKDEGDLVFQVPLDQYGNVTVVGLAYVAFADRPTILGMAQKSDWPQPSDPSSF